MAVVQLSHGREVELEDLSLDELLEIKLQLLDEKDAIRGQLEAAKAEVAAGGEYADPDWFRRATYASRAKGRDVQRVDIQIKKVKARHKGGHEHFAEHFVDVAREMLDGDLFLDVMDEAKRRYQAYHMDIHGEEV